MNLLALLILQGCTGHKAILEAYEAERLAAAERGTATDQTPPDLVVHLSGPLAQQLVDSGVTAHGRWKDEVAAPGGITLTPDVKLDQLKLVDREASDCARCLVADLALSGQVRYQSGLLGQDKVPVSATARVVVELDVPARKKGGWEVRARLAEVRRPVVDVAGLPKQVSQLAAGPLEKWLDGQLTKLEPFVLASFSGDDLPLAALRVASDGAGVRVEMVTDAAQRGRVDPTLAGPAQGVRVDASATSLVWIGRREAFAQGPVSEDPEVAAVPSSLEVDDGRFSLGFRLWKLSKGSWWWDLSAKGAADFRGKRLALTADEVTEVDHSKGAALADPLAMLVQGRVLEEIAKILTRSVPTPGPAQVDGKTLVPVLRTLDGSGDLVQLGGDLVLE